MPFPSPVDYIFSELSNKICPCWVALHGMAHSFVELDKTVVHVISLISFLWLWLIVVFILSSLFWGRRQWHPTPVLLPGKSHGRRSLVGCSPWGHESQKRLRDFTFTFHFHALEKEMATHSSVLAWRIPGTGEPGGLPSIGSHRVGHDWSNLAAAAAALFWIRKTVENSERDGNTRPPDLPLEKCVCRSGSNS